MIVVTNPASGERLAEVEADDAASVAAKAGAARAAQPAWARVPVAERLAVLDRFRDALVAERDALAALLTAEVGKPIAQSRNELDGLLPRIDFFRSHAAAALADESVHDAAGVREQIGREPLGVVANISAWNYPWFVSCNVLLPALVAGNAVLFKPSEFALLSGLALVRLLHAAGVPPHVLQALTGAGDVGALLVEQPLDGVFFTGSHATGTRIAAALAGRLVKLQLELGGKDPAFVRADADITAAAAGLADGAMYNNGQSCCAVERLYVHTDVHDRFVDAFVAAVRALPAGDPTDERSYVGVLARAQQIAVLEAQVADALAKGAELRCGGRPSGRQGFEATVLTKVDHTMSVMRDETFGPLIGIQRVADDDEAVRLMNDSRYGLTAAVYTRDEAAARALLSRVHAGSVYWNCCDRVSPRLPWSGVKDSGLGLTLGSEGIRTFTRPKAWHLRSA